MDIAFNGMRRALSTSAVIRTVRQDYKPMPLKGVLAGISLAILGLACLAGAIIGFGPHDPWFGFSTPWSLMFGAILRLTFLCAGIALLTWCVRSLQIDRLARTHKQSEVHGIPARAARKLQRDVGRSKVINAIQAQVFASAILWPTDTRQRIVETYTPERNTIRQRVSIEAQLPMTELFGANVLPAELQTVYFPVLVPRKGQFHDNFHVYDSDGASLPVLTYREYLQLAACTLHLLLAASAFDPKITKEAELRAVEEIVQRTRRDGSVPNAGNTTGHEQIRSLAPHGDNTETSRSIAADFAEKLRTHYAIVVAARPDGNGRLLVKYEQTLIPRSTARSEKSSRTRKVAVALGAHPLNLFVNLANASVCKSFHLHVNCPDYLYLRHQNLLSSEATVKTRQLDAPTPAHIRFRKRLGQPYAHFYARFFPAPAPGDEPEIKFTFCEVPPASVFRSSIAAVACFLLVWAVGVIISRRPDPGTDAPAFLLAFPAVAATLLGFDKPDRSLLDSTVPARLSLITTALLSVASSALFMAFKALGRNPDAASASAPGQIDWSNLAQGTSVLGITSWAWALLALFALANAATSLCVYAERLTTFVYLSSRSETEG